MEGSRDKRDFNGIVDIESKQTSINSLDLIEFYTSTTNSGRRLPNDVSSFT